MFYRPAKGSFNINTGDNPISATNNNQPFKKGVIYYIALPAVEATDLSMVGKDSNNGIVFRWVQHFCVKVCISVKSEIP